MDKRNAMLLTIIVIVTLLIAIVGATFAYFASNIQANNNVNVTVTTSNKQAVFMAESNGSIELNIMSYMMQEHDATNDENMSSDEEINNLLSDAAGLNVSLTTSEKGNVTECSYDIVWIWDESSTDFTSGENNQDLQNANSKVNEQKVYPSKYYIRTQVGDSFTTGFKELTIEGYQTVSGQTNDSSSTTGVLFSEINIDEFAKVEGNTDDKKIYLKQGETLGTDDVAKVNYQFTVKFYNLPTDQTSLMNKNFKAHISVENVIC